jgi:hypothetical protein
LCGKPFSSKKLHQLSNTGKKPARRKRVCEQHTDTQREVGTETPKERERVCTYYIHVPGLTTAKFSGSE